MMKKNFIFLLGLLVLSMVIQKSFTMFLNKSFKFALIQKAYADDDGDGDGDSDSDGDGDGNDRDDSDDDDDSAKSERMITEKRSSEHDGDYKPFEPGIVLAVNADNAALKRAKAFGLIRKRQIVLNELKLVVICFQAPKAKNAPAIVRKLNRQSLNAPFDLNHYYKVADDAKNDMRSYPAKLVGWEKRSGTKGRGAVVGMIDTFVDTKMQSLANQNIITRSFVSNKTPSKAKHGTAIATLIVGAHSSRFPGFIPGAKLYATNTFFLAKSGWQHSSALNIAQGLNWLVSKNVRIINLSIAGPHNKLLEEAIKRTQVRRTILVAAAGNNGPKAPPAFPAAYDGVIAVTAVDRFHRPYRLANRGRYVSLAAPGVSIWIPDENGRGQFRHGTSYASAYFTAMAAEMLRRTHLKTHSGTLLDIFKKNALDLGPRGKDNIFGWGLVRSR